MRRYKWCCVIRGAVRGTVGAEDGGLSGVTGEARKGVVCEYMLRSM